MEEIIPIVVLLVLVVLGASLALAVWLIVRAVNARSAAGNFQSIGKLITQELLWFGIPCLVYLGAGICGWFGILEGVILGFLSPLLFLYLAGFYIIRGAILWQTVRRVAFVDFVLMIFCIGGFYGCLDIHKNPFVNTFKARLKYEYKNHIPELQKWAATTLKTAKQETYLIDERDWPDWIKIAHFPKPTVSVSNEKNMDGRGHVGIIWGSGVVGGWGLIMKNPTLQTTEEKWADGVYFFAGQ